MSRHRRRALWPRVVGAIALGLAALAVGALVALLTRPAPSSPKPSSASAPACASESTWRAPDGRTWWSCAPFTPTAEGDR